MNDLVDTQILTNWTNIDTPNKTITILSMTAILESIIHSGTSEKMRWRISQIIKL